MGGAYDWLLFRFQAKESLLGMPTKK